MQDLNSSEVPTETHDHRDSQGKHLQWEVDLANVRSLMYALMTICIFCVAVLFGPEEAILPADGNMEIPIANIDVRQGSFLYFGPVIIIFVCLYTYFFMFRVLLNLKQRQAYSDQYIFTMQNMFARIATNVIFFWAPATVVFAFVLKALPRPESKNLLGFALIFLLIIISLQLFLYLHPKYLMVMIMIAVFLPAILSGFVVNGPNSESWLGLVRGWLNRKLPLTIVRVDLSERDLQNVDISKANAEGIQLHKANLSSAILNDANLANANFMDATLSKAKLNCANLERTDMSHADLHEAELRGANLSHVDLRDTNLNKADFYLAAHKDECKTERTLLKEARLELANLSYADLSRVSFEIAQLQNAKLTNATAIHAKFDDAALSGAILKKADLRCSAFTDAVLLDADFTDAKLYGAIFLGASLDHAVLDGAKLSRFNCDDDDCIAACIECRRMGEGDPSRGKECDRCNECTNDDAKGNSSNLEESSLKYADFRDVDFRGASLIRADLQGANLEGANLEGVQLRGANLFLVNLADVKGLTCNELETAQNWETSIRGKKLDCSEQLLNFENVEFFKKDGDFEEGTDFEIDAKIFWKVFEKINLTEKMYAAQMREMNLEGFDLHNVQLQAAQLDGAILSKAILTGAQLEEASLQEADLVNAKFQNANLYQAKFIKATLTGADFTEADLEGADFTEADLEGADFRGARKLTCEQLKVAINWKKAFRDDSCDGDFPPNSKAKVDKG